jgi:integrase
MLLSDKKIKSLTPKEKAYKVADGNGMYLLVKPNGTKLWHLKYRSDGKENIYSIGVYPEISLSAARDKRYEIRKLIKEGINPNKAKKEEELKNESIEKDNFGSIALEWHSKNLNKWTEEHAKKLKGWIENEIIPVIGSIQISEVKSPDILQVVKAIEERGALDVARRVLSICSQVLRYAMPLGKCNYDVTVGINKTLEVRKRENFKCIPIEDFPELLRKIENHKCGILTKFGLKLVSLTFVRSSELREAKWSEINFDKAEWRIPAERMKMKELHIVPLSKQALSIFKEIKSLGLSNEYILPSVNNPRKFMSENTLLYALYDMGYHNKMTVHGFRQIASTILNENGFRADVIERQLSHAERDNVRRAYNHAQYLSERREMMQWWGDYIESSI